jgi:release factor glutamine methyltransferase
LDSEVLLAHILNKNRSYFRAWPEKTLSDEDIRAFNQLIEKRRLGMPIAYLIGQREFWSRSFEVSPDVLIPRPDTELLIEIILEKFSAQSSLTVLDLGTGSGAIAITLALELPNAHVTAVDASHKALIIAKKNADRLSVNNIKFIASDWFNNVPDTQFDLVVSNPPYICNTDPHLHEGDVRFEPSSALISEHNGLRDIEHIVSSSIKHLKTDGVLLLEHGFQQGNAVQNLLKLSAYTSINQYKDIQGHTRATLGISPKH